MIPFALACVFAACGIALSGVLAWLIIRKYRDPKQSEMLPTVITGLALALIFCCVALVPFDVYSVSSANWNAYSSSESNFSSSVVHSSSHIVTPSSSSVAPSSHSSAQSSSAVSRTSSSATPGSEPPSPGGASGTKFYGAILLPSHSSESQEVLEIEEPGTVIFVKVVQYGLFFHVLLHLSVFSVAS